MIIFPKDFEYQPSGLEEFSEEERTLLEEAGLPSKPWAVCGHGENAFHEPPEACYFCGEKLTIPAIMWHGYNSEAVWMHPECTERLCNSLMRDVLELRKGRAYADQIYQQQKKQWRRHS